MDMETKYNLKSPAVKRLMREAKELREATEQYYAQPLEDNLFEWHFTVQGPADSDFENGRYHGRIILPPEYPLKPPNIMLLTPNGRFEIGKKICLSMSAHHPETWQPSWSIRTVLLAIIGFMPTKGGGAIGALDYSTEERRILAKKSMLWKCTVCGSCNSDSLKKEEAGSQRTTNKEAKELASKISFKGENENKSDYSTQTPDDLTLPSNSNLTNDPVNIPNGQPFDSSSVEETSRTFEDESVATQTTADPQNVRNRRSNRSSVKRSIRNGQTSRLQTNATEPSTYAGYLSTIFIVILSSCLVILLLRRIYKDYKYSSEST